MRRDVQEIFKSTPHHKQVMMFSATLSKEIRPVCRKFMNNVSDIFVSSLAVPHKKPLWVNEIVRQRLQCCRGG